MQWVSTDDLRTRISQQELFTTMILFFLAFLPLMINLGAFSLIVLLLPLKFRVSYRVQILLAFFAFLFCVFYSMNKLHDITRVMLQFLLVVSEAKFFETRNRRDLHVLFYLYLFALLSAFMSSTSVLTLLYVVFVFGLTLRGLQEKDFFAQRKFLPPAMFWRLVVCAFPMSVLMFFFMPRLAPMWAMPNDQNTSMTGLGESMSMGDVAGLAQSDEPVFRVKFKGARPQGKDLYWRGPVLWHFDGLNWTQRPLNYRIRYQKVTTGKPVSYEYIPLKTTAEWLTALDVLTSYRYTGDSYSVRREQRRGVPLRFELTSNINAKLPIWANDDIKDGLQLPKIDLRQTRELAQRLFVENGKTAKGFAAGFLKHISQEEFHYSLEPPPGMGNVENFLFSPSGKIGYCEHYSNAMALAARSIGIPARVVTGYQGGDYNYFTDEFLIREEMAHAWVELLIDDYWQRFDPTAAVAPYRIEQGRLNSQSLGAGEDKRSLISQLAEKYQAVSWLRSAYDAANSFWADKVIGYDRNQQRGLFEQFNIDWSGVAKILVTVFVMTIGIYIYLERTRITGDEIAIYAQKLLRRFAKRGFLRKPSESFAQFLRRMTLFFPHEKEKMEQAADLYESFRYEEKDNSAALKKILQQIKTKKSNKKMAD